MGVDERTKETFGVISRTRQLFHNVRFAVRLTPESKRVGGDVSDMYAMRSAVAALEETSSSAIGVVKMFRYIAKTSAFTVDVEVLCHCGVRVSKAF